MVSYFEGRRPILSENKVFKKIFSPKMVKRSNFGYYVIRNSDIILAILTGELNLEGNNELGMWLESATETS
jgi:hypothetical protein